MSAVAVVLCISWQCVHLKRNDANLMMIMDLMLLIGRQCAMNKAGIEEEEKKI